MCFRVHFAQKLHLCNDAYIYMNSHVKRVIHMYLSVSSSFMLSTQHIVAAHQPPGHGGYPTSLQPQRHIHIYIYIVYKCKWFTYVGA